MAFPSSAALLLAILLSLGATATSNQRQPPDHAGLLRRACPDYTSYAGIPHAPYSGGPLNLPFQRPVVECRKFTSPLVEQVIDNVTPLMIDKDLAQLFRNTFPNTLDTTIAWHATLSATGSTNQTDKSQWEGLQAFIVTGDINAEWLRDSTNQLAPYQSLASKDPSLHSLILGAINTQVEFVIQSPFCNAFQPPPPSGLGATSAGQSDTVHPTYDTSVVFECKYELDSLAYFLKLGNDFYENTGSTDFVTGRWYQALDALLTVLDAETQPTFSVEGQYALNTYTFQRVTTSGTETLSLSGTGNPLNSGTGLIRSAFRPSDDATIFGFSIPSNAMMSVGLRNAANVIAAAKGNESLVDSLRQRAQSLQDAVWQHGVVNHTKYGSVFAYEVDGYGAQTMMDDANIPSLLSLPFLGFLDQNDPVYQNTRKMILSQGGNPYYLTGSAFSGIGGPHVGLQNAWPMSRLVQALTTDDDAEIIDCINAVRDSSLLGLVHESINVNVIADYTRPWFAWANSLFAQVILEVAKEKPYLLFGPNSKAFVP